MFDWDIDGQIDHSITAKLKATQKRFNQSGYILLWSRQEWFISSTLVLEEDIVIWLWKLFFTFLRKVKQRQQKKKPDRDIFAVLFRISVQYILYTKKNARPRHETFLSFYLESVQCTLYIDYQNRHGSKDTHKNSRKAFLKNFRWTFSKL